jgi:hypothetical protein
MLNDATPWDGDLSARGRRSLPRDKTPDSVLHRVRESAHHLTEEPRGSRSCRLGAGRYPLQARRDSSAGGREHVPFVVRVRGSIRLISGV